MKHLLFLLFALLYLAKADAQNAPTVYYYGENFAAPMSTDDSDDFPMLMSVSSHKNVLRATIFDPISHLKIAVIRGKKQPCYGAQGARAVVLDSSFVLQITEGDKISFDDAKNVLTYSDNAHIYKTFEYAFAPSDTTITVKEYYDNGSVFSTELYHHIRSYSGVFDPNFNDFYSIYNIIAPSERHNDRINTTHYYPNGKPYTVQTPIKEAKNAGAFPYDAYTFFDTTGTIVRENVRWGASRTGEKFSLLGFATDGSIASSTESKTLFSDYTLSTLYENEGKNIHSQEWDCLETEANRIAFISEKPDGFFRKTTKYSLLEPVFQHSFMFYTNPLFTLAREDSSAFSRIDLSAQNMQWQHDACPVRPPYIVEGSAIGVLPDGEWRVYFVDTMGKKTTLAAAATFKQGVPDGRHYALDTRQDTLASVVYKMGALVYNKYKIPYLKQENSEQYLLDSINAAQSTLNKRNVPRSAAQHLLYQKDSRNIWQRDTILYLYDRGGSSDFNNTQPLVAVKERLSPDKNSIIRLKYFFPNAKNVPMSVVRYTAATFEIDSVAVLYNEKGLEIQRLNAAEKTLFHKHFVGTSLFIQPRKIQIPNDSTIITMEYHINANHILETLTTDSIGFTPTMQGELRNQQRAHFWLSLLDLNTNPKTNLIAIDENSPYNFINIDYTDIHKTSIHTQSVTEYDTKGKRYETKTGDLTTQYAPDGTTVTGAYSSDERTWNGLLTAKSPDEEHSVHYINGKRNGEYVGYNLQDSTQEITLYDLGKLQSTQIFDREKHLIQSLQLIHKNPYIALITAFNKKGEVLRKETFLSIKADEYDSNTYWDKTKLQAAQYYATDNTTKKLYLAAKIQQLPDSTYALQTWYGSGKPQIVRATLNNSDVFMHNTLYNALLEDKMANFYADPIKDFDGSDFLILHENGLLCAQGIGITDFGCTYDDKGNIVSERLNLSQEELFSYPKATETATCHWEDLPYQIGKMHDGHRVGEWLGYFRTTKKQLQYRINYDADGYLQGEFVRYDSTGYVLEKRKYVHNTLKAQEVFDQSEKKTIRTVYKSPRYSTETTFNKKQKIEAIQYYNNDTTLLYRYNTKTGRVTARELRVHGGKDFIQDSTFDKTGKLLTATIGNTSGLLQMTGIDSTGKYEQIYGLEGAPIYTKQADYIKNTYAETYNNYACDNEDTTSTFHNKATLLARLHNTTYITFSPMLSRVDFIPTAKIDTTKRINTNNTEQHDPIIYAKNLLATPSYTLKDNYGQSLRLTPRSVSYINIALSADSTATPACYNPIDLSPNHDYHCIQYPYDTETNTLYALLNTNPSITLNIGCDGGFSTTLAYPSSILHPLNSLDSAKIVFNLSRMYILKTYPHQYKNLYQTEGLTTRYTTKQQQIDQFQALPVLDYERIITRNTTKSSQIYQIAATTLHIIPEHTTIINDTPLNIESTYYSTANSHDNFYITYPHHQAFAKDSTLVCDNFLKQKKIRTLCPQAYFSFAPLLTTPIQIYDVLIDNTEINGYFELNTAEINPKALEKQCKQQHIDLIITQKENFRPIKLTALQPNTTYIAHIRYKAR